MKPVQVTLFDLMEEMPSELSIVVESAPDAAIRVERTEISDAQRASLTTTVASLPPPLLPDPPETQTDCCCPWGVKAAFLIKLEGEAVEVCYDPDMSDGTDRFLYMGKGVSQMGRLALWHPVSQRPTYPTPSHCAEAILGTYLAKQKNDKEWRESQRGKRLPGMEGS